ncbi:MAG: LacI family DNA-binding transcriptional regulator [Casimicrobiaceae bacterium]
MKAPAKLSDVARQAGVSTATVSRALSTPERLRPATLARVREAVRASGYVLDGAARALRSRKTRSIGAIVPTLDNAIFANTTHALQKTLEEDGYSLLIACFEYDLDAEVRVARHLIERGIDGIVLVGLDHREELMRMIATADLPYIVAWSIDRSGRHPCVGFHNREAAMRIADYLVDIGHRRFAMIAGETAHNDRARLRVDGVRAALGARGLALPDAYLVERPYSFAAGRDALRELMSRDPRPTAVICGNDVLAIGALDECRVSGIVVPDDVSLTGFDDLEIATMVNPALTTIHVPTHEIGRIVAANILRMVAGRDATQASELAADLVVRGSTAPPPLHR